jgi:hypothetical protein
MRPHLFFFPFLLFFFPSLLLAFPSDTSIDCVTPANPQTVEAGHSYIRIAWDNTVNYGHAGYEFRWRELGTGTWESFQEREYCGGGGSGCLVVFVWDPPTPAVFLNQLKPCTQYEVQVREYDLSDTTGCVSPFSESYEVSTGSCDNEYFTSSCYSVPSFAPCTTIECISFAGVDFCPAGQTCTDCSCANGNNGYTYLESPIADMAPGKDYSISLDFIEALNVQDDPQDIYCRAWIDFNQDLDFEDPGEEVLKQFRSGAGNLEGDIRIPLVALPGRTRMRISYAIDPKTTSSCSPVTYPQACELFGGGMVVDFDVNISAADLPECAMSPEEMLCQSWLRNILEAPCERNQRMVYQLGWNGETIIRVREICRVDDVNGYPVVTNRYFDCQGNVLMSCDLFSSEILICEPYDFSNEFELIGVIWDESAHLPDCAAGSAAVTMIVAPEQNAACTGETLCIDFQVKDFSDISETRFTVVWDPAVLAFESVNDLNPLVTGLDLNDFNTGEVSEGRLHLEWKVADCNNVTSGQGITLDDCFGDCLPTLFRLCFTALAGAADATTIKLAPDRFVGKDNTVCNNVGMAAEPARVETCNETENSLEVLPRIVQPGDPIVISYTVRAHAGSAQIHLGDGAARDLTDLAGSFSHVFPGPGSYEVSLRVDNETIINQWVHVQSCGWTGHVESLNGYRETDEDICDIVTGDGRIYLSPGLSDQGYYWTEYENIRSFGVSGDEARLEARIKASAEEGAISAYETSLAIYGSEGIASFYSGGISGGIRAAGTQQQNIVSMRAHHAQWTLLELVISGGTANVYFNGELRHSMPYTGQVGFIEGISFGAKGSGSVDWMRLYRSDGDGTLVYEETFDDCRLNEDEDCGVRSGLPEQTRIIYSDPGLWGVSNALFFENDIHFMIGKDPQGNFPGYPNPGSLFGKLILCNSSGEVYAYESNSTGSYPFDSDISLTPDGGLSTVYQAPTGNGYGFRLPYLEWRDNGVVTDELVFSNFNLGAWPRIDYNDAGDRYVSSFAHQGYQVILHKYDGSWTRQGVTPTGNYVGDFCTLVIDDVLYILGRHGTDANNLNLRLYKVSPDESVSFEDIDHNIERAAALHRGNDGVLYALYYKNGEIKLATSSTVTQGWDISLVKTVPDIEHRANILTTAPGKTFIAYHAVSGGNFEILVEEEGEWRSFFSHSGLTIPGPGRNPSLLERSDSLYALYYDEENVYLAGFRLLQGDAPWPIPGCNAGINVHFINVVWEDFISDIDGSPLSSGDVIGLFYQDENGRLICSDAVEISDPAENFTLQACGDDPLTPEKDGFTTGELFRFKVQKNGQEYEPGDLYPEYHGIGYFSPSIPNALGIFEGNLRTSALKELNTRIWPPQPPDCQNPTPLNCGDSYANHTNSAGLRDADWYNCTDKVVNGPEVTYKFTNPDRQDVKITMSRLVNDLELYLFNDCEGYNCIAKSERSGTSDEVLLLQDLPAGVYYVIVEGYYGYESTYDITLECGEFPQGDFSCDPTPIDCGQTVVGTTNGACSEVNFYNCGEAYTTGPEVAYTFSVEEPSQLTATLNITGGADLDLFVLDELDPNACIAYSNQGGTIIEQLLIDVFPGRTYYLVVDGFNGAQGEFELSLSCRTRVICDNPPCITIPEINCSDLPAISCNETIESSNANGNSRIGTWGGCSGAATGKEVIYRFYNPVDQYVKVELWDFVENLNLYVIDGCPTGGCIMSGDKDGLIPEAVQKPVLPAGEYIIAVDGFAGAESNFKLRVTCENPFVECLEIPIVAGENYVSSNRIPLDLSMKEIFRVTKDFVEVAFDEYHRTVYLNTDNPDPNYGKWDITDAYKVLANSDGILKICGEQADSTQVIEVLGVDDTGVPFNNYIPYLYQENYTVSEAFTETEGLGAVFSVLPSGVTPYFFAGGGVDFMMQGGRGYILQVDADGSFSYKKSHHTYARNGCVFFQTPIRPTFHHSAVKIPQEIVRQWMAPGDEIGFFTKDGLLCGSARFDDYDFAAILQADREETPQGEGYAPEEIISARIWKKATGQVVEVSLQFAEHESRFQSGIVYELTSLNILTTSAENTSPAVSETWLAYPNPAQHTVFVEFFLPNAETVHMELLSVDGRPQRRLSPTKMPAGHHTVALDLDHLSSGTYLLRLVTGSSVRMKRLVVQNQ